MDKKTNIPFPASAGCWKAAGKEARYDRTTLFDYIDGGAELYLSFAFAGARSRTYTCKGRADITVDLFDMGTPADAYGAFSQTRERITDSIGGGAQYARGLMLFRRDRYLVSILTVPETPESKDAVFALARTLDKAIGGRADEPAIVGRLPPEGLDKQGVRYFRTYALLNMRYYMADGDLLGLAGDAEAALGEYALPGGKAVLLAVQYPSEARAAAALASLDTTYAPRVVKNGAVMLEDKTWVAAARRGSFLAVTLKAPSQKAALDLAAACLKLSEP